MFQDPTEYQRWGTKEHLEWVLNEAFKNKKKHTRGSLLKLSNKRFFDFGGCLDGAISLLCFLNLVKTKGNYFYFSNRNEIEDITASGCLSSSIFLIKLISSFKENTLVKQVFNSDSIFLQKEKIFLKRNSLHNFPALRNLLIEGYWLQGSTLPNLFEVHPELYKLIEDQIEPKINLGNSFTQAALEQSIKNKQKAGDNAQDFVLSLEKKKFQSHSKLKDILDISKSHANAGFDIKSFQSLSSSSIDKAIEVKSYTGSEYYWYWTNNEIKKAEIYGHLYSIYLVNRDLMNEDGYQPKEIKNPSKELLKKGSIMLKNQADGIERSQEASLNSSGLEFIPENNQWSFRPDGWIVKLK
jgi:hypothetical protein